MIFALILIVFVLYYAKKIAIDKIHYYDMLMIGTFFVVILMASSVADKILLWNLIGGDS